jgi:hypothetical protein
MEQPLGSLHEFVRELERAPHYRYSSIHCIETLSHPLKARLRDHDEPERSRSQTRRPTGEHASLHHPRTPSLGNACRRQLGSVARHPASEPPRGRDERPTRRSFSSHHLASAMESDDARAATPSFRNMSVNAHVVRCLLEHWCRTIAPFAAHRTGWNPARWGHPLQDTAPARSPAGRAGTPSPRVARGTLTDRPSHAAVSPVHDRECQTSGSWSRPHRVRIVPVQQSESDRCSADSLPPQLDSQLLEMSP